jgi:hypothetical protein
VVARAGGAVVRWVLWVPGKFRLTNAMLSDLRAAGKLEGMCRKRRKSLPSGFFDAFAAQTQAIRLAVKGNTAVRGRPNLAIGPIRIWVTVLGHHKHDPDAWLLLGKAAVDGLVDAGVLRSDRFDLHSIGGRVNATDEEDRIRRAREVAEGVPCAGPGFLLELASRCGDFMGGDHA